MNDIKAFEVNLQTLAERFRGEIAAIRTNRPAAKLVEDIRVDYFDQKLAVKQLGAITVVPPREIVVTCWDPGAAAAVAKAIETSSLGLSVVVDGKSIRLNLPPLTDERRRELVKLVRGLAENVRIKIRSLRDNFRKIAKDLKDEDERFKMQERIQEMVDKTNRQLEEQLANKIKEIND